MNIFPPPLSVACSYLVLNDTTPAQLQANTTVLYPTAVHKSGPILQPNPATKLNDINWYTNTFLPKIQEYYKGELATTKSSISSQATTNQRNWVILYGKIYDLTDYFYTKQLYGNVAEYSFIPSEVSDLIQQGAGSDISNQWKANDPDYEKTLNCMENAFYEGIPRLQGHCQMPGQQLHTARIYNCHLFSNSYQILVRPPVWLEAETSSTRQICDLPSASLH